MSFLYLYFPGFVNSLPLWLNGRTHASGSGFVGSNSGRAIPKALKMVPVVTLLGAQYYKASTGFTSPNKY